MKEWIAQEKYDVLKHSPVYETHVFAVIEERPKALDVFIGSERCGNLVAWVPRSQCIFTETDDEAQAPVYVASYAEACEAWKKKTQPP